MINGYFANAESIDKIKLEANFAKNKDKTFNIDINGTIYTKTVTTTDNFEDILKHLWKKAFTENADDTFDAVWGNANLKTSLFSNVDEFDDVIKSQKKALFDTWVTDQNDILFKFIKTE